MSVPNFRLSRRRAGGKMSRVSNCGGKSGDKMKPPVFEHHLPQTLHEALQQLKQFENAKVLAGGQSLMPMLNLRLTYPDHLVDLNALVGLSYIREEDGEVLIGAMTAQRTIEFSEFIGR